MSKKREGNVASLPKRVFARMRKERMPPARNRVKPTKRGQGKLTANKPASRGRKPPTAKGIRAFRACAAVCVLIIGACSLDAFAGMLSTLTGAGALVAEATQDSSTDGQAGEDATPPSWLEEELFSLEGREGVCVSDDGAVVGFQMDGDAARSLDELTHILEEKGWTMAESGLEGNAAFVKKDGTCRWAWVSCIDVAGTTSVVVQCAVEAV